MKALTLALMVGVGFLAPAIAIAGDASWARLVDLTKRKGYNDVPFEHICKDFFLPLHDDKCIVYQLPYTDLGITHSFNVYTDPAGSVHIMPSEHDYRLGYIYLTDLDGKLLEVLSGNKDNAGWTWSRVPIDKTVKDRFKEEVDYWLKNEDRVSKEPDRKD